MMHHAKRQMLRFVCVALIGGFGCGDDEGGGGAPPPAAQAKKAKDKGKADTKAKKSAFRYPQIEDVVSGAERAKIRRFFRESDFAPDVTGTDNRDPFRSYLIMPAGTKETRVVATANCARNQQIAPNFSVRDLKLVGILGITSTLRYAQFQDGSNVGHKVKRNDCLGREKARVKDISRGFVILEIATEAAPGMAPPPPEERTIPLYPTELRVDDPMSEGAGEDETPGSDSGPLAPLVVQTPAPAPAPQPQGGTP